MAVWIRDARLSDYENLCKLFIEENQFHASLVPDYVRATTDVMTREELQAFLTNNAQRLFVCAEEDELMGAVLVSIKDQLEDRWWPARRMGYIDDLIVTKAAQGRGIGKQLMQAARDWVVSSGVQTIELHVWEDNLPARRFYQALGLRDVRRCMTWELDSDQPEAQ